MLLPVLKPQTVLHWWPLRPLKVPLLLLLLVGNCVEGLLSCSFHVAFGPPPALWLAGIVIGCSHNAIKPRSASQTKDVSNYRDQPIIKSYQSELMS
jgi:hypothetical protein